MHTHIERWLCLCRAIFHGFCYLSPLLLFLFLSLFLLLYTQLHELRSRADDDFFLLLRKISLFSFSLCAFFSSSRSRFHVSFIEITTNKTKTEMKINIEVDFNFPPDYGNPVLDSIPYISICMTMCLMWRFSVIVIITKMCVFVSVCVWAVTLSLLHIYLYELSCCCLPTVQIRSRSFNVYKSQMLWQMIIVCFKRSNVKNEHCTNERINVQQ